MIGIDFETFYSSEYSLSKHAYNTSEYIRDAQFLIHGVGIQIDDAKPYWITGHDEALKHCQSLGLDQQAVVAHNMAFDGFILHEHAGIHCGTYCDTLSMARATMGHHIKHNLDNVAKLLGFGGKTDGLVNTRGKRRLSYSELRNLASYCMNDTKLCMQIYDKLLNFIPAEELELIDITLRMFCDPRLLVDTELVWSEYEEIKASKKTAIHKADTETDVLMSNNKFADLLRSLGVKPPMKTSLKTGKQAYAFAKTDPGFRDLLKHSDEAVVFAASAREEIKSTLGETRALRLFNAGQNGQLLPVLLNFAAAHTLRWSGGNKLNLQNLPSAGVLRRSIMAPADHQIMVLDLSQIEARLTAWLARQMDILQAFAAFDKGEGEDVYKLMACKVYGKQPASITPMERFIGKICVLALGFGMGWKRLIVTLAVGAMGPPVTINEQQSKHIVYTYRNSNAAIVNIWERFSMMLEHMAVNKSLNVPYGPITFKYRMIELPNGLALKYPGLTVFEDEASYMSRNGRVKIWGGTLLENIVQALARCVVADHMREIHKKHFVASMTHDEIIAVVPTAIIEQAYKEAEAIMVTPPAWAPDLPLAVEGGYDVRYSK